MVYINFFKSISSSSPPEKHVERLQKERANSVALSTQNVATQSCVRQLAKLSPNPELFLNKYEELESKKYDLILEFLTFIDLQF